MADENKQAGLVPPNEDQGFSTSKAVSNFFPSLLKYGKDVVHAFTPSNIPQTIQGMGELGRGTIYNVTGYNPPHMGEPIPDTAVTPVQKMLARRQGYGEDPAQVQRERDVANSMGERLAPVFKYTREGGYQGFDPESWKTFGKHVEEDPVGTLSLNAPFIGTTGSTIGKIAGTGSRIAETANLPAIADALDIARTTGNIVEKGKYLDPLTSALDLTGAASRGVKSFSEKSTGVDDFQDITDLYSKTGREGKNLRDIYDQFSSGKGDYVGLMQDVKDWAKDFRQKKVNEWSAKKQQLSNNDIPLSDVLHETQLQADILGDPRFKLTDEAKSAIDFLTGKKDPVTNRTIPGKEGLIEKLSQIEALPAGHPEKSLVALDLQKQYLYDLMEIAKKDNPALYQALTPIHSKLIETLTKYGDSSYGSLMKEYSDILNEVSGINASTGSNMNKVAQFRRMMSSKKNPVGKTYLDMMSEDRPSIGAALLGSSASNRFLPHGIGLGDLPLTGTAATAFTFGQPVFGGLALAGQTAKFAAESPKLTSGVAKVSGALERNPITSSAKRLIEASPTAAKTLSPFQSSMEAVYKDRLEQRLEKEAEERIKKYLINQEPNDGEGGPLQVTVPVKTLPQQAEGGRIGREAGGRTNSSAAAKAAKLIDRVDHIRKNHGKDTSSLLNLDDNTVAKALEIANQKI